MLPFSFLRLRARPAEKGPPPRNFVDIAFDPESGKIKAVNSEDDPVTFDGSGGSWGSITGTLSSQADLQAALNAKAASSHTHVSADITDATTNGESAPGKILKTDSLIGFVGAYAFIGTHHLETRGNVVFGDGVTNSGFLETDTLSDSRYWNLPNVSGKLCIIPSYANSTAADAAVSVGDVWWDSTLNKARVRLV